MGAQTQNLQWWTYKRMYSLTPKALTDVVENCQMDTTTTNHSFFFHPFLFYSWSHNRSLVNSQKLTWMMSGAQVRHLLIFPSHNDSICLNQPTRSPAIVHQPHYRLRQMLLVELGVVCDTEEAEEEEEKLKIRTRY